MTADVFVLACAAGPHRPSPDPAGLVETRAALMEDVVEGLAGAAHFASTDR